MSNELDEKDQDTSPRCPPHEYCEPGCSIKAHCWMCSEPMPQTAEWDAWWPIEDGEAQWHRTGEDGVEV